MHLNFLFFLICVINFALATPVNSATAFAKDQIHIAAASDMKFALDELKENFIESNPNIDIGITTGSSGKFFEQIINGAPFDIFFSADIEFPKKLKSKGFGTEIVSYGVGRIVLWTIKYKTIEMEDLKDPKFKTIAIANPAHAPYGIRAIEVLKKMGIYDAIKAKLVLGENISQATQFVETGAADVGIIALSIVMAPNLKGIGLYKIISNELHSPLEQGFIVLKNKNSAALKFSEYMKSKKAKKILKKYGLQ